MPSFKVDFTTFSLDPDDYIKTMDRALLQMFKKAVGAFVQVAAAAIPVRTGFARGSLGNLAAFAGVRETIGGEAKGKTFRAFRIFREVQREQGGKFIGFQKSSLKRAGKEGRKTLGRIEFYKGVLKTPQSGRQFATPLDLIYEKKFGRHIINYEVNIDYFNINDERANRRTPSAPWKAFERGRATFFNYIQTIGIPNLPQFTDFTVLEITKVRGTKLTKTKIKTSSRILSGNRRSLRRN